jgi:hypothetical protein
MVDCTISCIPSLKVQACALAFMGGMTKFTSRAYQWSHIHMINTPYLYIEEICASGPGPFNSDMDGSVLADSHKAATGDHKQLGSLQYSASGFCGFARLTLC